MRIARFHRSIVIRHLRQYLGVRDRALFIFWTAYLLANLGTGIWSLVLNLYLLEHGFRADLIGTITSCSTFGTALAAIPSSRLLNRLSERATLALAGAVLGIAYCAQALWPTPLPEVLFSLLGGGALALLAVAMVPFLANRVTPTGRSSVFATTYVVQAVALMIGSLLGGYIPSLVESLAIGLRPSGFGVALFVGGLCSLASTLLFARLPGQRRDRSRPRIISPVSPANRPASAIDPFDGRGPLLFAGVGGVMAISYGLTGPFFNVYLSSELQASAQAIGAIFFVAMLAGVPAAMVGPALVRWLGPASAVAVARLLGAPLLGLIVLAPSVWLVGAAFVLRNVSATMAWPIELAFWTDRLPPRDQARGIAFRTTATNLTWGLAGMIGGQIVVRIGYAPIFVASCLLLTTVALIYQIVFRRRAVARPAVTPAG